MFRYCHDKSRIAAFCFATGPIMNRATSIIISSIISCLVTLFVIHHWDLPQKPVFNPPARVSTPSNVLRQIPHPAPEIPRPIRQVPRPVPEIPRPVLQAPRSVREVPRPIHQVQSSVREAPPSARNIPPSAPRFTQPVSAGEVPFLRESIDCSDDFNVCGEGGYCCEAQCYKAVNVDLTFVADDMGELYLCQQHGYNLVASTKHYQETGRYSGPMPCTDTYLTINNTAQEGGATILILGDNIYGASGTETLDIESEVDRNGNFDPIVIFDGIANVSPYREYATYWGAHPVTDASNSYAGTITLKFTPAGC